MQFVSFINNQQTSVGILVDEKVLDVARAVEEKGLALATDFQAIFEAGLSAVSEYQALVNACINEDALWISLDDVTYGPYGDAPEKVICIGLNYRKHAVESNLPIPKEPVVFGKFSNTVCGHGKAVDVTGLEQLDYESELGLIIGKGGRNISEDDALEHVFGYCNANDLSERALQFVSGQWLLGKTTDDFLPMGPVLVTADEFGDPNDKTIKGWLNGELRQNSHTSDMIFNVKEIIAYVSKYMTLKPGDVIVTGTPEGVILGFEDKVWMKPGDTYEVEIEGLGKLSNQLISK